MKFQIVTNNPYVHEQFHNEYDVLYLDVTYKEVLIKVRDYCHKGYQLLSHPLSGSVKPNETPYKSVMISAKPSQMDMQSIELVEKCIASCDKFTNLEKHWSQRVLEDFQLIDYTLISSAVESAKLN